MRILFVGQAPSRETDGKPPFTGKCGRFLAKLLEITQEKMLVDHDFINVLDHYPGKGINGDRFPILEAGREARKKIDLLRNRKVVVLLGSNVARAFGAGKFTYLQWYEFRNPNNFNDLVASAMAVVPHPSGVNRYYNDPRKKEIVGRFLSDIANKSPDSGPMGL